jgi:hypothetical protein
VPDYEQYEKAMSPEDITRLFVERSNAGDAAGVAALYEPTRYWPTHRALRRRAGRASARCGRRFWPPALTSSRNPRCRPWSAAISP